MSLKASSINGLPIVTLNDGKNINKVKDVIYDGHTNAVKALLIDEKGWFSGAKILLLEDVHSIGKDAVIIKDEDCFVSSDDQSDDNISVIVNDNNFLTKNRVMTESGVDLGRVTDIYFDFPSGNVMAIEVSKGFMNNIGSGTKKVNVLDIITIGKDNLIVRDFTEEVFEIQSQEQGVNKIINDTKVATASIAAATVSKSQEIFEATKSKFDEVVNSQPVQDTMAKTQEIANSTKENIVNSYNSTKEEIQSGRAEEKLKETFNNGKEKVQEFGHNVQDKVSNTYNNTKEDIESGKTEHDIKEKAGETKENIENTANKVKDNVTSKVEEIDHNINNNIDSMNQDLEYEALGKFVQTDVISYNNQLIAKAGEKVTEDMIKKAKETNTLEKLLGNL